MKRMAELIHNRHYHADCLEQTDNMYVYGTLFEMCHDVCADETSFNLTLVHLNREKLAVFAKTADGEKIVILTAHMKVPAEPTASELSLFSMKTIASKMERLNESQAVKIEQCRAAVKQFVRDGNRIMALKQMKRMKMLEAAYARKETALDRVYSLVDIIEQSESNKQILDTCKTGYQAYRCLQSTGLNSDSAEATMQSLQEAIDDTTEMNTTMATLVTDPSATDDTDIETQLDEMFASETVSSYRLIIDDFLLVDFTSSPATQPSAISSSFLASVDSISRHASSTSYTREFLIADLTSGRDPSSETTAHRLPLFQRPIPDCRQVAQPLPADDRGFPSIPTHEPTSSGVSRSMRSKHVLGKYKSN